MDESRRKPAILCLHGGGTSAAIYKIQTLRLRRALETHFDFVFIDGPFITSPGPGVLPFFDDAGPYYSWERSTDLGRIPDESMTLVRNTLKKGRSRTGHGFVAIMGFSQGAKLGAAVMLEEQERSQLSPSGSLQFGIFLMAICGTTQVSGRLRLPTIHVIGSDDEYNAESKRFYEKCCAEAKATCIELAIGHRVPVLEDHTKLVAEEALKAYRHMII